MPMPAGDWPYRPSFPEFPPFPDMPSLPQDDPWDDFQHPAPNPWQPSAIGNTDFIRDINDGRYTPSRPTIADAVSDIHRRAAQDGAAMYRRGLQNLILGVLAQIDEELRSDESDYLSGILDDLRIAIGGVNVEHNKATFSAAIKTHLPPLSANFLLYQYPTAPQPISFHIEDCWQRASEMGEPVLRDRGAECVKNAIVLATVDFYGDSRARTNLDGFIREMSTIGSFEPPIVTTIQEATVTLPSGQKVENTTVTITEKQKEIVLSEEKVEIITLHAEAGLGALLNGEYDIAAVQFRLAAEILAKAISKQEPVVKPVQMNVSVSNRRNNRINQSARNSMDEFAEMARQYAEQNRARTLAAQRGYAEESSAARRAASGGEGESPHENILRRLFYGLLNADEFDL
jgi:hypothetical protein